MVALVLDAAIYANGDMHRAESQQTNSGPVLPASRPREHTNAKPAETFKAACSRTPSLSHPAEQICDVTNPARLKSMGCGRGKDSMSELDPVVASSFRVCHRVKNRIITMTQARLQAFDFNFGALPSLEIGPFLVQCRSVLKPFCSCGLSRGRM